MMKKSLTKRIVRFGLSAVLSVTLFSSCLCSAKAATPQSYREFGILPSTQIATVQLVNGQQQSYGIPSYGIQYSAGAAYAGMEQMLSNDAVARALELMHAYQTMDLSLLALEDPSGVYYDIGSVYDVGLLQSRLVQNYSMIEVFPYAETGIVDIAVHVADGSILIFHVTYVSDPALRYQSITVDNIEDTIYYS